MVAVTKLIELLDKPALVKWANKIGLEGINIKDYRSDSTKKGIATHNDIEKYLKEGVLFEGYEDFDRLLEGYEILGLETEVKNNNLKGRIDLILKKDGLIYVIDFKTSKYVYLSTKLQLSTYKHMYGADKIGVISFYDMKINLLEIETKKYYDIIKRLYQIHELIKELKERL